MFIKNHTGPVMSLLAFSLGDYSTFGSSMSIPSFGSVESISASLALCVIDDVLCLVLAKDLEKNW
jgi:hypothetical protein